MQTQTRRTPTFLPIGNAVRESQVTARVGTRMTGLDFPKTDPDLCLPEIAHRDSMLSSSGRFRKAVVIDLTAMAERLPSGGSRGMIGRFCRIKPSRHQMVTAIPGRQPTPCERQLSPGPGFEPAIRPSARPTCVGWESCRSASGNEKSALERPQRVENDGTGLIGQEGAFRAAAIHC